MQHRPFPLQHQHQHRAEWDAPFAPVIVRPADGPRRTRHAVTPIALTGEPSAPPVRIAAIYHTLGLRDDPFPIAPPAPLAPAMLIPALADQVAALSRWMTAPAGAGRLAVVSGPARSGRSTLLQAAIAQAGDAEVVAVDLDTLAGPLTDRRMLHAIVAAFGAEPFGRSGLDLVRQIRSLAAERARADRFPVLTLDSADLAGSRLDLLRALLVDEAGPPACPLRIVITGTPAVRDRIQRRQALRERLSLDLRIEPLDVAHLETFIQQRIAAVALADDARERPIGAFTPEAVAVIHEWSGGIVGPAVELAGECLLEAIARGTHLVNRGIAHDVAREFTDRARDAARHEAASPFTIPAVQARLPFAEEAASAEALPASSPTTTQPLARKAGGR